MICVYSEGIMKLSTRLTAFVLVFSMVFSLTSCTGSIKEYDKDSFVSALKEKLELGDEDIVISRNEGDINNFPEADIVVTNYEDAAVLAYFCDDESGAKRVFDEYYSEFNDTFNQSNMFKGNYIAESDDNSGCIVINGDMSGVSLFGTRFAIGKLHGGVYYSGSMIVMVIPASEEGFDSVGEVIKALGFKDA